MTTTKLLEVISRGADRLAQIPTAQQTHALAQLETAAREVACSCGFNPGESAIFAEDLVRALRATLAARGSDPPRVLH